MKKITYKTSGVDIDKANRLVKKIKPLVASTKRRGWVGNIGAFAGFFKPEISRFKDPVLIASTDGVGTKLIIAQSADIHHTVGIDLVAMCVNDLVTCGAEPLFFLDYFASGKLKPNVMYEVLKGIAKGCRLANTALIGGETAELPGMYGEGVYDIAGFTVGIIDKKKIIDGSKVRPGDLVLGIQSSGIHSNGYSMVRKVFSKKELLKNPLRDTALKPTIIYVKPVLDVLKHFNVRGIANITGGGFYDNIIRALARDTAAIIFKKCWDVPEIFNTIQKRSGADDSEMFKTFNMGIGMVMIASKRDVWNMKEMLKKKHGLSSWIIGEIAKGKRRVELIDL